jgi:hypothetical protein
MGFDVILNDQHWFLRGEAFEAKPPHGMSIANHAGCGLLRFGHLCGDEAVYHHLVAVELVSPGAFEDNNVLQMEIVLEKCRAPLLSYGNHPLLERAIAGVWGSVP